MNGAVGAEENHPQRATWVSTNDHLAANSLTNNDFRLPQTKSPDQGRGFLLYLVPEIGIEPTTYALRMRRSTN